MVVDPLSHVRADSSPPVHAVPSLLFQEEAGAHVVFITSESVIQKEVLELIQQEGCYFQNVSVTVLC